MSYGMKSLIIAVTLLAPTIVSAQWRFQVQTDAFTDTSSFASGIRSDTGGFLGVTCANKLLTVVLKADQPLYDSGTRLAWIKYRIDKGPVLEVSGVLSSGGDAIVLSRVIPGEHEFNPLLSGLQAGQVITVETTNNSSRAVRHQFPLMGSSAAIQQVLKGCASA